MLYSKLSRALTLLVAGVLTPVFGWGAATDIANSPMAVSNLVKSNILFTVDNSGGVDVDVLLPTFNSMYIESHVTNTTASNTNGFFYLFPNAGTSRLEPQYRMGFPGGANPDPLAWRAYYYGYNAIYYNPYTTYNPWVGKDNAGNAFAPASATAARLDPYLASGSTYNLTSNITYTAETYLNSAGTACINGSCTSEGSYSSTIYPASYYVWTDTNGNGVMDANEGVLYQIKSSTTSYPSGRTYAAELQNFANWFQYYRTPYLAFKGYLGASLSLMSTTNVGVVDLDHTTPNLTVQDMSVSANIASMQTALYSIATTPNNWTQPMHERTYNAWKYFNTSVSSTSPTPPIQYACQQNFNIVVSPGYLNDAGYPSGGSGGWANSHTAVTPPSISTGNYDGTTGTDPDWGTSPYSDSYSNTLADWTAYYYDAALRTDLATGQVPIPTNSRETNTNLHMSTYVLAPGAVPQLSINYPSGTLNLSNAQTANIWAPPWTPPTAPLTSFPWQQPCFVCENTIDDMWHAAVNGRGLFVNSTNIYSGLQTIVDSILDRTGAAASVAVVNANISSANDAAYASSYRTGAWSGDLGSFPISLTAGTLSTTPTWTAATQLDALGPTHRFIGTYNGTAGVGFNWTSINTTMQGLLNTPVSPPGLTDGSTVLNFLRGDRTQEGVLYRTRDHVLGDIIDAAAVVVGPPSFGYSDTGYQTFFTNNSTRGTVVYQGANDGMLHAFSSTTGAEVWAYVPGFLFNSRLAAYASTSTLVNLSLLQGFTHLYYVDSTPSWGDVDMGNVSSTPGAASWKTILVGGAGKGGNGFYALDITTPTATADSDVAAKVLWEFPNSSTSAATTANVGYSFGVPVIAKTKANGWVVLVTSGYNNTSGDGKGHLFVLNPSTGAVVADLSTGVGSSTAPSGLAQISAFAYNSQLDATIDYVYGGDLQGNVWRFDLSGATVSAWNVSKLATLVDSTGTAQPITVAPQLATVTGHRMVYVATGEYLGLSDVPGQSGSNSSSSQTQTIYGLWDNKTATPLISPLRSQLVHQTLTTSGTGSSETATDTSLAAPNYSSQLGWYVDLPGSGERVNVNLALADGVLTVVSNTPVGSNPCTPGGTSMEYFFDYLTGGYIPGSTTTYTGSSLGSVLSSGAVVIELPSGQVYSVTTGSNDTHQSTQIPLKPNSTTVNRVLWREILTQ